MEGFDFAHLTLLNTASKRLCCDHLVGTALWTKGHAGTFLLTASHADGQCHLPVSPAVGSAF